MATGPSSPSAGRDRARGIYAFEHIDDELPFIPLAARRVLDVTGVKLTLEGWLSLPLEQRRQLVDAGAGAGVDPQAAKLAASAHPAPAHIAPVPDPESSAPPPVLLQTLGPARPLDSAAWAALSPLARYALGKYATRPDKVLPAYDEIVGKPVLSHLTASGDAHMVDISSKALTAREAVASACVRTTAAVIEAIASGGVAKGDVLGAARIAGLLAAKRTPELVPLCHPVQTTGAAIDFEADAARGELRIRATVEALDRTGVEMEAMVAAAVASLTVYDMIKSADRWAVIDAVRLEAKSGGKSGDVRRPASR
jgi:cyclic pyranopterin phosphate synthase